MTLLATVWVLLVMPNASTSTAAPKEFQVENVSFASLEDCDAAGRKWMPEMADAAAHPKQRHLHWDKHDTPPDVTVTFSCVEQERP